ncbi:MAG TPA: addiction module protein [Azonexus sp.]|jgi:putative addiction module component (TIGR02574 family)|nr:addiction module protein [Azonexus sp.]
MPPTTIEAIEAAVMQLTSAERSYLAERLLDSLEEDDEVMSTWLAEAERRGEAFDRGEEVSSDVGDVIARIQKLIPNATER